MYRCELERRLVRYDLATCLTDNEIAAAIMSFEPTVPWEEFVLKQRVMTYEKLNATHKDKANHDLEQFERWRQ